MKKISNKHKLFGLLCVFGLVFAGSGLFAQDYQAMLKQIDDLSNFDNTDFSASLTLVTQKVGEERSVLKVKMFRRDKDKKFVLLINEPAVQKGEGYLRIDDNMWFYDPNTRNFSFTSLKERFSSSGANNDDLASSSLSEDYKVSKGSKGKLGKTDVYILNLEAKNNTVPYPYMTLYIHADDMTILKQEEYSLSKQLMRTSLFTDYAKINGRYIARKYLFIDNLSDIKDTPEIEADKTQMTMSDVSLGKIPDEVFTKAYLEAVAK